MDLLLDLVERQRIDLGRMSILILVEQFLAGFDQMRDRVALERRADWLVMATRLVLLRSRLLFPENPAAAAAAARDAATALRRIDDLAGLRAAAAPLARCPAHPGPRGFRPRLARTVGSPPRHRAHGRCHRLPLGQPFFL